MRSTLLLAGCLAALACGSVHAQRVNKCVDANGKTMYSSQPCPSGATASTVKLQPGPAASAATADPGTAKPAPTPEAEFQKRRSAREEAERQAAKEGAAKQDAQQNCTRARGELAELEMGRVIRIDAGRERRFLDDNEVAAEKAKARALVEHWCR